MKNQSNNNNTISDATGVSDQWFNRLIVFALAGMAASLLFGALTSGPFASQVAALVSLR